MSRSTKVATLRYAVQQLSLSTLEPLLEEISSFNKSETQPDFAQYFPDLVYIGLLLSEPDLIEWTEQYFPPHLDSSRLKIALTPHIQTALSLSQKLQCFIHLPRKIEEIIQNYLQVNII